MKKKVIIVVILSMLLSLFGCNANNITLPKYLDKECYYGEGFQDYTDFCKYFYNDESIKNFETHNKFKIVKKSDIENIKSYFENFDDRVSHQSYYNKYDFDYQTQVKEGDYFNISTKEGTKIGESIYDKFDSYDVYYVDMEKCIVYFIHSNT